MEQEVTVVTGASSGIGLAISKALLAEGRPVVGLSRHAPEGLGQGFRHIPVDLSDPASLATAFEQIGAVSAVVHAAGLLRVGRIDGFDFADGETMWRLHVEAAARLIQLAVPKMGPRGRIVAIGSRVAKGAAGRALYAASKSALSGLIRSVAAELAPKGITANIVAPGATETPMLKDPNRTSEPPRMPPMGRLIQPDEVAALVGFLLSPMAAPITGQEIVICGGASL